MYFRFSFNFDFGNNFYNLNQENLDLGNSDLGM